ncbi:MAG: hypothetical protein N2D54_12490 [Chloroflexota bacterium]
MTNLGVFKKYFEAYFQNDGRFHKKDMTLLIRQLAPDIHGVPLEFYGFTKTTDWGKFEDIQAEVFAHLIASVSFFDLRVFQHPTGSDFQSIAA